MNIVTKFLGRYPLFVSSAIILCFGASVWAVTYHFETTIRPLQEQIRLSHIASEIAQADSLLKRKRYETAMKEYKFVLDAYDAELSEQDKGHLNDALGLSYLALSNTRDQVENLNFAIKSFKTSLTYRPPDAQPILYAATWKHMGQTYESLAIRNGSSETFTEAINSYKNVVSVHAVESDPESYAMATALLGGAYRELYGHSRDDQHIRTAFQYYEEALGFLKANQHPEAFGLVLAEMGRTYSAQAVYSRRTTNSEKAIKIFGKALKVLDRDHFPSHYAQIHKYIGDAYTMLIKTKPRNRWDAAEHAQRVNRYQNKANAAYKIAQNFGFEGVRTDRKTTGASMESSKETNDSGDAKK